MPDAAALTPGWARRTCLGTWGPHVGAARLSEDGKPLPPAALTPSCACAVWREIPGDEPL